MARFFLTEELGMSAAPGTPAYRKRVVTGVFNSRERALNEYQRTMRHNPERKLEVEEEVTE